MNLVEEIRGTLRMEIRPNSRGALYLEAVFHSKDLEPLLSLLKKHLGEAAKAPYKEAILPEEIKAIVEPLGGVRIEQSFYYRKEGHHVTYAAIWPWQSNPDKFTLKCGVE